MAELKKLIRGTSTAGDIFDSVNGLVDNTNKTVISGDTAISTQADFALRVDGQVKMTRNERNVNETHRPVWFDLDYIFTPPTAPANAVDYHGVDIFGDVGATSYGLDLSQAQLYLTESKSFYSGTDTIKGNYAAFFEATNNSSGTVVDNVAVRIWSRNRSDGHTVNQYGILMTSPNTGVGTVDNSYGIYINDISNATNSYAIYTRAGKVRFGENVEVVSDLSVGDDLIVNGSLSCAGNITTGADLDAVTVTTSQSGNNFNGAPTTDYYFAKTTVHNNLYAEQILTGMIGAEENKVYRRIKSNGVWQAWREITTSPIA